MTILTTFGTTGATIANEDGRDTLNDVLTRLADTRQKQDRALANIANAQSPRAMGFISVAEAALTDTSTLHLNQVAALATQGYTMPLTSGQQQIINREAHKNTLKNNNYVLWPAGTWDMKFSAFVQGVACNYLRYQGAGGYLTQWLCNTTTLFDNKYANLDVDGIWFNGGGTPLTSGYVFGFDAMTSGVDFVRVTNCIFTNLSQALRCATNVTSGSAYALIKRLDVKGNIFRGQNGLAKLMSHRFLNALYEDNDVDCGVGGGIGSANAGVVHGYVQNDGNTLTPDDIGTVTFVNNVIRNVKPLADPGSAGNYGIQAQAKEVICIGNRVEKVYPFYGSFAVTGNYTSGSPTITNLSDTSRIKVGQKLTAGKYVAVGGFPASAVVQSIDSATQITISQNATQTVTNGQITFTQEILTETLFTGDGTTTTFTGTLTQPPTPDSLKVMLSGSAVASDADYGWARGEGGTGNVTLAQSTNGRGYVWSPDVPTNDLIGGRDPAGAITGWIDYNNRTWSLTFATAPASGAVYSAQYFSGLPIDNVEPLYFKSNNVLMFGNVVKDCQSRQGALGLKGGGSYGYQTNGPWSGGPGAQFGAIVMGNTVKNRVQTGIFNTSRALWIQHDRVVATNNYFEGVSDIIARFISSGDNGRQVTFKNNLIKDFYGDTIFQNSSGNDMRNFDIECDIDGWWFNGQKQVISISVAGLDVRNFDVSKVRITERYTAGTVYLAVISSTSGSGLPDIKLSNIRSLIPWTPVQKKGTGTTGRIRLQDYCTDNLVSGGKQVLTSGASAIATFSDDGGWA